MKRSPTWPAIRRTALHPLCHLAAGQGGAFERLRAARSCRRQEEKRLYSCARACYSRAIMKGQRERSMRLTELDACVLGLIGEQGECSAYELRQLFQNSPTSTWQGSTGTIYPLVKKLERLGLIGSRATADRRGSRRLRLLPAGRSELRRWLTDWPEWVAEVTADPLRTRMLFLAELTRDQQLAFVDNAVERTRREITRLKAIIAQLDYATEPFNVLVHQGALAGLKARKIWLQQTRRRLLSVGEQ
jgi:DNA-binding PadR family transcriptional regulator